MQFEPDDAENVATRRYINTNEFYLYQTDKGIYHLRSWRGRIHSSTIICNCIKARARSR